MKNFLSIVCFCFIWATGASAGPNAHLFKVGTAIGSITPATANIEADDFYMGGYGFWKDRGAATGTHDLLTARAICIEAQTAVCLVVLDTLGVPGPLAEKVKQAAALRSGLPAERILISATHTHAAPDLMGLWGGSPTRYRNRVIEEVASTVTSAYHGRVPSKLSFAAGKAQAHNRRGWGYTDDELGLLLINDPANEVNLGAVVFFAAHPVVTPMTNQELSSDFVHFLREDLTKKMNAPVIYFNGAIGDVNPHSERHADYWQATEDYGREIADNAFKLIPEAKPLNPSVGVTHSPVRFAVENTTLNIAGLLGIIEGNTEGPIWNRSVTANVNLLNIGELSIATVPGEVTTRLGLKIKSMLPDGPTAIIGQTDDALGYLIPEDEWQTGRNGDYEESVSLGRSAAASLMQGIQRLTGVSPDVDER